MEFSVIPGRIQIEQFILVDCFRKKGSTLRGISYFLLFPELPEISVPFVHTYQCQAPTGSSSEKEC